MKSPSPLHFQRFEIKYLLDTRLADRIIFGLKDYMHWDDHCQAHNNYIYSVSSLYFDSFRYSCYFQKEAGIRNRVKLRLRFYGKLNKPNLPLFLEIKRKKDMVIVKDRVKINQADCGDLLSGHGRKKVLDHYPAGERKAIEEFLWTQIYNGMQPKLMVTYDRQAFESPIGLNFRVTFDFNIRASPARWIDVAPQKRIAGRVVVMEVKFNNIMPSWFHDIIQKYQLSRDSFSKYANSLENPWQYILF